MLIMVSQIHIFQTIDAQTTVRCDEEVCHVNITKNGFEPNTMIVKIGTTVVWTNDEGRHTVTSGSPGEITGPLKSNLLESGDIYAFTFHPGRSYEGNYRYFDQATSNMRGEIIVEQGPAVIVEQGSKEVKVELDPEEEKVKKIDDFLKQCKELLSQGNSIDALFFCDEVLRFEPNNIEGLITKGTALILLEKYNRSILAFDKTLELEPLNVDALGGKGVSLLALGEDEKALTYITTALEFEPDNIYSLVGKASFLEKQGYFMKAIIEYDKVMEVDPEHDFALLQKARLSIKLFEDDPDKYEEALSYYDQILAFEPNNLAAIVGKANILSHQGEDQKAILAYGEVLEHDPDNADALLGLGTILLKLEQYNLAIETFENILKIDPGNIRPIA